MTNKDTNEDKKSKREETATALVDVLETKHPNIGWWNYKHFIYTAVDFIEQIRREDRERNNNALIELNKTLHEQLIDTGLVTLEQWNEEIAPKMRSMHLSIDDVKVSARTFRLNP